MQRSVAAVARFVCLRPSFVSVRYASNKVTWKPKPRPADMWTPDFAAKHQSPLLRVMNQHICEALKKDDFATALQIYKDMPNEGVTASPVTFKLLLQSFSYSRRWDEMDNVYTDMKRLGLLPDPSILQALLEGYAVTRNVAAVLDLVRIIEQGTVAPTIPLYSRLLFAYCMIGYDDKAFAFLEQYRKSELSISYLMDGFYKCFRSSLISASTAEEKDRLQDCFNATLKKLISSMLTTTALSEDEVSYFFQAARWSHNAGAVAQGLVHPKLFALVHPKQRASLMFYLCDMEMQWSKFPWLRNDLVKLISGIFGETMKSNEALSRAECLIMVNYLVKARRFEELYAILEHMDKMGHKLPAPAPLDRLLEMAKDAMLLRTGNRDRFTAVDITALEERVAKWKTTMVGTSGK